MNIHMNEFHGVDIYHITSFFNNEFHEEWTWASLDIVDEIHELSPWPLICCCQSQIWFSTLKLGCTF